MGDFIKKAAAEGIVIHQIASKAPWQQGKTERHGGHFKELLDKARSEVVVQDREDLKRLMAEVEQAKNRYSNRSGFSPAQRQIGQWPTMPTPIMSDEAIDPTLLDGVLTDDIEKLHHMRRAFCEYNARTTFKKALRSRPRVWTDFKAGEYVFVYRVPRLKKRKSGGPVDDALTSTKARWVGPGVVIAPDGANLWVSMMGELWKVAREQCRQATTDEKAGIEAVLQECQELIEEFKRGSHRTGFKDITLEELPPEEDEGQEAAERPPARAPPIFDDDAEVIEYVPEWMDPDNEEEVDEQLMKRRRSINEPEQEEAPSSRASSERGVPSDMHNPTFPEGVPETPARASNPRPSTPLDATSLEVQEAMRISEENANRLDGTPTTPGGPIYRWQERSRPSEGSTPYLMEKEWFLAERE